MQQPVYKPIYKFQRSIEGGTFDVLTDGINPTLFGASFNISNLPTSGDFTALFDVYRIDRIDIVWRPEYTELVDSGLASNAVNVNFNSAIDITDSSAPASVNELIQYSTLKSTSITKTHARSFRPAILMNSSSPCFCWNAANAATTHLGVKVAIPATGVAMNFVSKVTFHMSWASSR